MPPPQTRVSYSSSFQTFFLTNPSYMYGTQVWNKCCKWARYKLKRDTNAHSHHHQHHLQHNSSRGGGGHGGRRIVGPPPPIDQRNTARYPLVNNPSVHTAPSYAEGV